MTMATCSAPTDRCKRCRKALRRFRDTQKRVPNLFDFHLEVKDIRGKKKQQRVKKDKLKDIEILLSALINSEGGIIIVHLKGLATDDRCLSYFDEFVEDSVKNFIEDGSLYVDIYSRDWLSAREGCKEFPNFVCIKVEKSKGLATYDFKTKVCTDFKIERPSSQNLLTIIKGREIQEKEELLPITLSSVSHESRSIQFKRCIGAEFDLAKNDPQTLARFIWINLRLREYLSCMSKVPEGGSYFLGIFEEKRQFKGEGCDYESFELVIEGFEICCSKDNLEEELTELAKKHMTFLGPSGSFQDNLPKFFDLKVHRCTEGKVVVEVEISFVQGIVFYDKLGPESYRINPDGDIERIPRDEWLKSIQQISDNTAEGNKTES